MAANQVELVDGVAYASVGTSLRAFDVLTGEQLQDLTIPGVGVVTDLAREGSLLYAFVSGSQTFSIIDIATEGAAQVVGQLDSIPISDVVSVFAANGIAYLGGAGGAFGTV